MRSLSPRLLAAAWLVAGSAQAAPCARPDLRDAFPPNGASAVPTDAVLTAHYGLTADYLGEPVELERVGGGVETLSASFDANEGLLTVVPPGGLIAGARYELRWPSLRGKNSATKGRTESVSFAVGDGPDRSPPTFAGVAELDWDVVRDADECTEGIEERYAFDLSLAPADDDGGRGSLALIVFQTAGPGIDASTGPVPISVSHFPAEGTVRVVRPIPSAIGHVCFAAIARDLVGNVSAGGSSERCADTVPPPFFYGCSSAPPGRGRAPAAPLGLALLAFFALRRGRWSR
ncbi:MAG: hypothetical protein OZ921_00115 [Sorangiineae bacterium]|nr:hypothetical protein [Polyangiaceae bacterium]MEB2320888.1 hypothetical protein [Sorangiineae bacterium]